jgi:hypothetical protein
MSTMTVPTLSNLVGGEFAELAGRPTRDHATAEMPHGARHVVTRAAPTDERINA